MKINYYGELRVKKLSNFIDRIEISSANKMILSKVLPDML